MDTIERILKLMETKGITKYELHKLTGIGRSTIYSIFDSKTNVENVKLDHIRAIAQTLGTTLDYLVYGESSNKIVIDTIDNEHYDFRVSAETIQKVLTLLSEEEVPL